MSISIWVDMNVMSPDGRWLAVAMLSGETEVGIGHSASAALAIALSGLGAEASGVLIRSANTI
jgi:hypothetical protein